MSQETNPTRHNQAQSNPTRPPRTPYNITNTRPNQYSLPQGQSTKRNLTLGSTKSQNMGGRGYDSRGSRGGRGSQGGRDSRSYNHYDPSYSQSSPQDSSTFVPIQLGSTNKVQAPSQSRVYTIQQYTEWSPDLIIDPKLGKKLSA